MDLIKSLLATSKTESEKGRARFLWDKNGREVGELDPLAEWVGCGVEGFLGL